jgi:hypothetical protein
LISLANLGEPATFVRSPIMMYTPFCCVNGCEPESRSGRHSCSAAGSEIVAAGAPAKSRGCRPSNALAMAAMCSGVLPQQPPAMLTSPDSANSLKKRAMSGGSRSKPVGESGLGRPAFG